MSLRTLGKSRILLGVKKKSKVVKGNALGPGRSDKFKWFSKRFKVVSVADK